MTHEDAQTLIEEYESGTLGPEQSAELRAHLASCEECRAEARIAASLRRAAAATGEALLSDHPDAEELAGYALADNSFPLDVLARIQSHLEACETCRRELDLVREAARSRKAGKRRNGILPLVIVVVALVALVPLLHHPRDAGMEHAAAVLVIPAADADGATPSVRLAPGQEFLQITLSWQPAPVPDNIRVDVFRSDGTPAVDPYSVETDEAFDQERGILGLLLPAVGLDPGVYRLRISDPVDGAVLDERRFAISAP